MQRHRVIPVLLLVLVFALLSLFSVQAGVLILSNIHQDNAQYYLTHHNIKNALEKAQTELIKVKKLTPESPKYQMLQANLLIRQKKIQQAEQLYQKALQNQPNNPFLWAGLATTSPEAIKYTLYYAPTDKNLLKYTKQVLKNTDH